MQPPSSPIKPATALRAQPARPSAEYEELPARLEQVCCSHRTRRPAQRTPRQLVGQRLTVRLHTDHIKFWIGGTRVLERARLTHRDGQRHPRDIDTPNRSISSGMAPQGEGPRCIRTY